jgi:hypothetical protein
MSFHLNRVEEQSYQLFQGQCPPIQVEHLADYLVVVNQIMCRVFSINKVLVEHDLQWETEGEM